MTASDADRAKAVRLVVAMPDAPDRAALVAAALASERAAAVADLRARVLALAEELEESGTLYFAARIRDALRAAVTDTTGGTCTCGADWPCAGPAWMGDHSPERITSADGVLPRDAQR